MTPQDGIVLGIYAPWGAGKTTLLNFVQHYLDQHEEAERPVIVPFNPWWFSGQDDLAISFFRQLLSTLNKDKRVGDKIRGAVEKYADFVGQGIGTMASVAAALAGVPVPPVAAGAAITHGLKIFAPTERSINDLKADVEAALRESKIRLLIIIDDIDRLPAEEVRQLFRVVKAVADFPNVIYLLAFDRTVAAEALKSVQGGDGNDYLEKIIQVPFELPLPDSTSLEQMLFQRLDRILADEENADNPVISLFNVNYWGNVFRNSLRYFIDTPRDVVRLTNTLSVTYPSVRNEANPVDFIAIETLRVFAPDVYNVIRSNSNMFTGPDHQLQDYEKEQFKDFHTAWFSNVEKKFQEPIKDLMLLLFPKTRITWDQNWSRSDSPSEWGMSRRIAHPDVFPVFFRLAVPVGDLTNAQMHEALRLAINPSEFGALMLSYQKTTRADGASLARRFCERLEDFTSNAITPAVIPSIIRAFCDVADLLIANEPERQNAIIDFGISFSIKRIFFQIMRLLPEEERFQTLCDSFKDATSYYFVADETASIGTEYGKFGSTSKVYEYTLTAEHLASLEQIVLSNIRHSISIDYFKQGISLRRLLLMWQEWSGSDEAGEWLKGAVATDDGLLKVLVCFSAKDRFDPFWFKPFFDPATLRGRVETLPKREGLSKDELAATLMFLQEFEDRDNGLNPEAIDYTPRRSVSERLER